MIGIYVLAGVVVSLVAIGVKLRDAERNRATLEKNCRQSWASLHDQLRNRHLIVSHLIDSVAGRSNLLVDVNELSASLKEVESRLDSLQGNLPGTGEANAIGECESKCLRQLRRLRKKLKKAPDILSLRQVTACWEGLDGCDEQIDNSKAVYNAAVITYNTHLGSREARCLTFLNRPVSPCGPISFDWYASDSGLSKPSPCPKSD
ncbi:hypothetical protein Pla22_16330 [Rubripirellula amarantea]|uniref:LemA family protein n=1 Tax=Rubripirellula amarantea TaxID=2527999 RepID=A0A5C5WUS2_9BACT|nr:LemA family protein [Rubripirellula amarantea]TWT53999.1 hypothetical protein Pla22_16330 [Rubripirellula amarantea]